MVRTLNEMRPIWDPDDRYRLFAFTRQAQTFPDVLLRRLPETGVPDILLGLELKGWYLLAEEGEPSFRFTVTPAACNPQDMIVVVPWALSNVISGSPRAFQPFIESARYVAEFRNYHWRYLKTTSLIAEVSSPVGIKPYPRKSDRISDRPKEDAGGNFGRLARTGVMDEYIAAAKAERLCGIEARDWLAFFKIFQEQRTSEVVERELTSFARRIASAGRVDEEVISSVRIILDELRKLLSADR
ncbi:MAG: hypothetical protein HY675_15345 [Chloroflexi bacterium]|nr:hypothetical protein [Chloroflexota bacterium]